MDPRSITYALFININVFQSFVCMGTKKGGNSAVHLQFLELEHSFLLLQILFLCYYKTHFGSSPRSLLFYPYTPPSTIVGFLIVPMAFLHLLPID
jgi:hypothetical protein